MPTEGASYVSRARLTASGSSECEDIRREVTMLKESTKAALIKHLTEASTIRGIIVLATLIGGWTMQPDQLESVVAAAVALSQVLKIMLPDKLGK